MAESLPRPDALFLKQSAAKAPVRSAYSSFDINAVLGKHPGTSYDGAMLPFSF
jgi:hypothetical protein